MKNLYFCIILLSAVFGLSAQDIYISFQPKSDSLKIDSILVTNQRTNKQVVLAGNDTLLLSQTGTGIISSEEKTETGYLYPNPCFGDAVVSFSTNKSQNVILSIINISGQLLGVKKQLLAPGYHRFNLKFPVIGNYAVKVQKDDGFLDFKVICAGIKFQKYGIAYAGSEFPMKLKSAVVGKAMIYVRGDILLYSVFSGKNNTIVTDSPTASKVYSVEFYKCIDPDNQSYPIVKIGKYWWMAGNLRTTKYTDGAGIMYVTDNSSWAALQTGAYCLCNNDGLSNKDKYGALYNWHAANSGKLCPAGWHVPDDVEWKQLETAFEMTQDQADAEKWRGTDQGTQMKTTRGWYSFGNGTNTKGFSALPGGYRNNNGSFEPDGIYGFWWSSTEYRKTQAWYRFLYYDLVKVYRGTDYKECGFSVRCVRDALSIPPVTTSAPDSITINSVILGGEVTGDGGSAVIERGICYSTTQSPTTAGSKVAMGSGTGAFNGKVTGLTANTKYYVRAYATNSAGTNYGNQVEFTTSQVIVPPTVNTYIVTEFTQTTATCGGIVTSEGGAAVTARGVCWNTTGSPTIAGNKTTNGSGIGSFVSNLTGLTANTKYYVRAYAINSQDTAYGEQVSFTTDFFENCGTVTDINGNTYKTVQIGTQCWMRENLKTTKYRDGAAIPYVTDNTTWDSLTSGAYFWYYNDADTNRNTYGALYNWHAVNTGKLCPTGWHVPGDAEWKQLEMALGMTQVQADALGARGTDQGSQLKATKGWLEYTYFDWDLWEFITTNGNGTNSSGFSGLPGSYYNGNFNSIGQEGFWWSSTEYSATNAWLRHLDGSNYVYRGYTLKNYGFSIRCVRDN